MIGPVRRGGRPVRVIAGVLVALVLLGGCGTLRDVPLPGLVSGPTYPISAEFTNALGLPEQAAVRYRGATIGEVTQVHTKDYRAVVGMKISDKVSVPAGVRAEIRFSSPMGEAFVELTAPDDRAETARLRAGSVIGLDATSQAPSATDLLASVSTLVTGGSFADMKVIIGELNTALSGNAGDVRELVGRLDTTLTHLNQHTARFDRALNALGTVSGQLVGDRALLDRALDDLPPAIATLSRQRDRILALMKRLRELSHSGTRTMVATRRSLTSVMRDLGPILRTLERNERTFGPIFDGIRDFGRASDTAGYGLFANFDLTTVIQPADLVKLAGRARADRMSSQAVERGSR